MDHNSKALSTKEGKKRKNGESWFSLLYHSFLCVSVCKKYPIIIIKSTLRVSLHYRSHSFFSSSGILSFPFRHQRGITGLSLRSHSLFTSWALSIITSFPFSFLFFFLILILFASEVSRWVWCYFVFWFNSPLFLVVSFIISLFFHVGFLYFLNLILRLSFLFLFWVLYMLGCCLRVWFVFFLSFFLKGFCSILCWFERLEQLGFGKFVRIYIFSIWIVILQPLVLLLNRFYQLGYFALHDFI